MNANRYMRDSLRTADRSNMDRLKLECALGLCGEAGDAAHLADTERDLHQGAYGGGRCCLGRHGGFLLQK